VAHDPLRRRPLPLHCLLRGPASSLDPSSLVLASSLPLSSAGAVATFGDAGERRSRRLRVLFVFLPIIITIRRGKQEQLAPAGAAVAQPRLARVI
jgi:hypothetical protein